MWVFKSSCATLPSMKSSVPISSVVTDLCRSKMVLLTWIDPKQISASKGKHNANSTVTTPLRWFRLFETAFLRRNFGWHNIGLNFENNGRNMRGFHFRTLCQESNIGRINLAILLRGVENNNALLFSVLAWLIYLYGACREYAGGTRHSEYVERAAQSPLVPRLAYFRGVFVVPSGRRPEEVGTVLPAGLPRRSRGNVIRTRNKPASTVTLWNFSQPRKKRNIRKPNN